MLNIHSYSLSATPISDSGSPHLFVTRVGTPTYDNKSQIWYNGSPMALTEGREALRFRPWSIKFILSLPADKPVCPPVHPCSARSVLRPECVAVAIPGTGSDRRNARKCPGGKQSIICSIFCLALSYPCPVHKQIDPLLQKNSLALSQRLEPPR